MNTHAGYSKKTLTDTNVLLTGGGDKSLADFLGGIQYVSASHKILIKTAAANSSWTDLVTLITTDENVKQTPKTDDTNRPLMMINGGTATGALTSTSMFSTDIYANAKNKTITSNGFIKAGSDSSHVLLGDGDHKPLSDFMIDAGGNYENTLYSLKTKTMYSAVYAADGPNPNGWISGIVLGYNWNNSHYQTHLVQAGSRWYTTNEYENSLMKNWKVFAYLTDLPTKSSWNYDDRYVTELGTSNNYLTWTKNGSVNNILIPYATNAATADWAKLLKPIASSTTASASTWNIPSGSKQVWGERFSDNTLKYTPSGGTATTITDTGDWVIWLTPNATANNATLNMRIDGTYYGSFNGNLTGNATSATYATSAGDADTLDGYHANSLLTAASLGASGNNTTISVTVGGHTETESITVPYASNADMLDEYHYYSFMLDAGDSLTGTMYDIPTKRIFSSYKLTDAPTSGWISGLVLGSNWNNDHYQCYLVESYNGRWYTTRSYENKNMTNWKTFAYLSDLPTKSSWNYNDMYVTALGISGNYLTWTKNGTVNNITIPYATNTGNADTIDNFHANGLLTAASLGSSGNSTTLSVTVGGTTKTGSVTVPYATNSDTVDEYHADSFVIDAGGNWSNKIYDIPTKRVFSGHSLSDAPTSGWVSGLVLGSNWNNSHYQCYLVESSNGRWYTTRSYESGSMKDWKTLAYTTDITAQDHYKTSPGAGTAGTSSATSGSTLSVPYVTVNANGHVTAYGTHTHTITGFAASSHTHPFSQITDGTSSSTNSSWSHILSNTYGGSLKSILYMCHGGGYGMHLRGYSTSASVYMLLIYNSSKEVLGVYGDGHSVFGGNVTATHFYESSDIRLKHDIFMMSKSIRKFRFNNDNKLYYGFIAQELEETHPELVDNSGEYKTVNYNSAICYYIAELENRILNLEDKLKKYEEI